MKKTWCEVLVPADLRTEQRLLLAVLMAIEAGDPAPVFERVKNPHVFYDKSHRWVWQKVLAYWNLPSAFRRHWNAMEYILKHESEYEREFSEPLTTCLWGVLLKSANSWDGPDLAKRLLDIDRLRRRKRNAVKQLESLNREIEAAGVPSTSWMNVGC